MNTGQERENGWYAALTFLDDLTDKDLCDTRDDHGDVLRDRLGEDVIDELSDTGLVQRASA